MRIQELDFSIPWRHGEFLSPAVATFSFSPSMLYSCRSLINTICQVVHTLPLVKVEVKN